MINIKLHPNVFAAGGLFENVPENRAVLMLSTGKPEADTGLVPAQPFGPNNEAYISNSNVFPITTTGVSIYNTTLQLFRQNAVLQSAFGQPILDFVQRGLITVDQDGVVLTYSQILNYTAP